MRNVSNSAGQAAVRLFGTITTTADAISTGVNSIGNLCAELEARSNARLVNVHHDLKRTSEIRIMEIDVAAAERKEALYRKLAENPTILKAYEDMMAADLAAQAKAP